MQNASNLIRHDEREREPDGRPHRGQGLGLRHDALAVHLEGQRLSGQHGQAAEHRDGRERRPDHRQHCPHVAGGVGEERADPDAARQLRLEFVGRYKSQGPPQVPESLRGMISFQRYMPPEEVGRWQGDADVLLLVEAKMAEGDQAAEPVAGAEPAEGETIEVLEPVG